MKELVLSIIMSLSAQADTGIDFQVAVKDRLSGSAIAQHAYGSKSGQHWILVSETQFNAVGPRTQEETILHEMAHAVVHEKHGHTKRGQIHNRDHRQMFKSACLKLAKKAGVNKRACQAKG